MTKYAYYDSTILPNNQVIGWIDSEVEKNMPPMENLFEMSEEQWNNRSKASFYVSNDTLITSDSIFLVAQNNKKNELVNLCSKQIISGFVSNALGKKFTYASTTTDQLNIMAASQSVNGGLLSFSDDNGNWSKTTHTQSEAKQVFEDMSANTNNCRSKLNDLLSDLSATNNIDDIKKISW